MGSRLTGNKEGYPIQERRKGDIALPMEARIKQPKNISHKVILSSWADEVQKMVPEERKSKSVGEERRRQSGRSSGSDPRTF